MLECLHVRVGDVGHVYIVAHAGAVGRVVIVAEDAHRHAITGGREHQRNEVGLRVVQFPDLAVGIGARGIKVAQRHPGEPRSGP